MRNFANLWRFYLMGISAVIVLGTACNPIKKMQKNLDQVKVEIVDEVLEVHADSVNIFFNTKIPAKYFKPKAIMKLEPVLVYGQDSVYLDPFFIAGEKVDLEANKISAKNTVSYDKGGLVEYRNKAKYEEGMRNAIIYIVTSYKIDSEYDELDVCVCDIKKTKLSEGVITTSQTAKNTEDELLGGSFAAERMVAKGNVYYQKNASALKKGQSASKDFNIPFVLDPVRDLALKEGIEFESISTVSQASPDGAFAINERLANNREKSSFTFITGYLKDAGFEAVYDSAFFKSQAKSEDWDGLKQLISNSDLKTKGDVLKIIASNLQLDEKEDNIRKLVGDNWSYLASDILPKLRKTEIVFTGKTKIRDLAVLQQLYKDGKLDQLYNKQELLLLAFNETDLDKQLELFELYKKNNPDEYVGDNNIAGIYLQKGETEKAMSILEPLSKKYPDTREIINNIAVGYKMMGQYDTAMTLYDRAAQMGAKENNNKGILYIKTADYDMAVQSFEGDRYDYNRALAYTLKKDYDNAKNVVEKIDDKSADDFYLRAIIGARTKDVDLMTTSLTRAIKLDASIRQRAKEDYEFKNYWDKPEFLNAIK